MTGSVIQNDAVTYFHRDYPGDGYSPPGYDYRASFPVSWTASVRIRCENSYGYVCDTLWNGNEIGYVTGCHYDENVTCGAVMRNVSRGGLGVR